MINNKITLDFSNKNIVAVNAKQHDKQSRYLEINCVNKGQKFDLSNSYAYIRLKKPDGNAVFNKCSIENGNIIVELTEQMLAIAGKAIADILILTVDINDLSDISIVKSSVLSTMTFNINIVASAIDNSEIESSYEFNALNEALEKIEVDVDKLDKIYSEIESFQNEASISEQNRVKSENERINAEETRQENENERKDAEERRVSSEVLRANAEENRVKEHTSMMSNAEKKLSEASNVNISAISNTNSFTVTVTNRKGTAITSPNLINLIKMGTITTVSSEKDATASITGDFGNQKLNLSIPRGKTPSFSIGTVTTSAPGTSASASITGTDDNPLLNLIIPRGDTGTVENISADKIPYDSQENTHTIKDVVDNISPYIECTTDRSDVNKKVDLSGFELKTGAKIIVRFTSTSTTTPTSGNMTLNVNNTGAKPIVDGHANKSIFTYTAHDIFYNNYVCEFVYDGTYWVLLNRDYNSTYTNMKLGNGYGTCSTAATTTAKVATLFDYNLLVGGYVSIKFTYAVPANATLNINEKGAKNIFYKGSKITENVIKANDLVTFIFDGSQYVITSIDRWQSDLDSKAPISHAITTTTYGKGTNSVYGHVKLSDVYSTSVGDASSGVVASQKALFDAYSTLNSNLNNICNDRINNIYADSSHAYPLICKDIQAGQVTVEQAVKDAVANGFFSTNGAYIGLIIHGSWEFYTAIAVNDAKYISVLIHGYSGEIHQLVWSGGELVNHRVL